MSGLTKVKAFIDRNMLMLVMLPSLAGLHWFWQSLQEDEKFVAKHERREFPPITVIKLTKNPVLKSIFINEESLIKYPHVCLLVTAVQAWQILSGIRTTATKTSPSIIVTGVTILEYKKLDWFSLKSR